MPVSTVPRLGKFIAEIKVYGLAAFVPLFYLFSFSLARDFLTFEERETQNFVPSGLETTWLEKFSDESCILTGLNSRFNQFPPVFRTGNFFGLEQKINRSGAKKTRLLVCLAFFKRLSRWPHFLTRFYFPQHFLAIWYHPPVFLTPHLHIGHATREANLHQIE